MPPLERCSAIAFIGTPKNGSSTANASRGGARGRSRRESNLPVRRDGNVSKAKAGGDFAKRTGE